jgi:hypothetical protein
MTGGPYKKKRLARRFKPVILALGRLRISSLRPASAAYIWKPCFKTREKKRKLGYT